MSTFYLKLIAIITMLIDHTTVVLIPVDSELHLIGRIIGRLAFPIFAFLLVEGFYHTKNIKKYLIRLGIFALVSEIPFDLAFYNNFFDFKHQNIFFTLFLGLCTVWLLSLVEVKFKNKLVYINILNALITIAFSFIAAVLRTDYGFMGILIIVAFYLFRGSKIMLALALVVISGSIIQGFSVLSMIPIWFYNGKKGKSLKYFFYAFYPAHILALYLISLVI